MRRLDGGTDCRGGAEISLEADGNIRNLAMAASGFFPTPLVRPPRAGLVNLHSGGSGTPPGRHYDRSARSSLHWPAATWVQEARPGVGAEFSFRAKPPVERREAWRPIARTPPCFASTENIGCASRRSAPLVVKRGKGNEGVSRAFQKTGLAKLWLFENSVERSASQPNPPLVIAGLARLR
jgi:hypothetical protein